MIHSDLGWDARLSRTFVNSLGQPGMKASDASFPSSDLANLTNVKDFAYARSDVETVPGCSERWKQTVCISRSPSGVRFKVRPSVSKRSKLFVWFFFLIV